MAPSFEWHRGIFSVDTAEFDRALRWLRHEKTSEPRDAAHIKSLVVRLRDQAGIPRREFDRRIRLILDAIAEGDPGILPSIAGALQASSPEALNAIRTLLPAALRYVAVPPRANEQLPPPSPITARTAMSQDRAPREEMDRRLNDSEFLAVALVGTFDEHVRNDGLLRQHKLDPYRIQSLDELWEMASTGLCGFVIGGSVWRQIPPSEHPRVIRLVCEYSTFLFSRTCLNGLSEESAQSFTRWAKGARCGTLDGQRFCHGQDCELSLADISELKDAAKLLDAAGKVEFFPLGLSESEAALLRLIAEERRRHHQPVMFRRLGTRELAGGRSGSRVFLLNDGSSQPFVAKVGDTEILASEVRRFQEWIRDWEPNVTDPALHSHSGSAAVTFRLQAAPDIEGIPAPSLEQRLEELRLAEWTQSLENCVRKADDLYLAVERAIDRLVQLNSRSSNRQSPDEEFWLHWPVRDLATRGIDFTLIDKHWRNIDLWELIQKAHSCVRPNLSRGVVHGDIHGRNILLLDRLPAFIDFAWSGPGHPLVDLIRLDATVRASSMRMLLNKQSMRDLFHSVYVVGADVQSVLRNHPALSVSPLARLAIRTAARVRTAADSVSRSHGLDSLEFYAMHCIVSAYLLVNQAPGSGVERLLLSVLGAKLLSDVD